MSFSQPPISPLQQLWQRQDSATIVRLGRSRHVADLRMIFWATIIMMVLAITCAALLGQWEGMTVAAAVKDISPFVAAVVAATSGVLTWTYQSGSARLGIVDLFACEITTLCRVAIVVDMVQRYVDQFHPDRVSNSRPSSSDLVSNGFTSEERYFPVFDATVKDLQALEADVVQHVTQFYTYMKVMRDTLRKLSMVPPPQPGAGADDEWHHTISSVIYMQFLALESARHAIRDLVEYEPTQAEDTITILLSELIAYEFLRNTFQHDTLRHGQLKAREEEYRSTFQELRDDVAGGRRGGPRWAQAKRLFGELATRYDRVFPYVAPGLST